MRPIKWDVDFHDDDFCTRMYNASKNKTGKRQLDTGSFNCCKTSADLGARWKKEEGVAKDNMENGTILAKETWHWIRNGDKTSTRQIGLVQSRWDLVCHKGSITDTFSCV